MFPLFKNDGNQDVSVCPIANVTPKFEQIKCPFKKCKNENCLTHKYEIAKRNFDKTIWRPKFNPPKLPNCQENNVQENKICWNHINRQ